MTAKFLDNGSLHTNNRWMHTPHLITATAYSLTKLIFTTSAGAW
jgi:hypothetical protein